MPTRLTCAPTGMLGNPEREQSTHAAAADALVGPPAVAALADGQVAEVVEARGSSRARKTSGTASTAADAPGGIAARPPCWRVADASNREAGAQAQVGDVAVAVVDRERTARISSSSGRRRGARRGA